MCIRGIEATDTTYTALISAYAKAERLEDAVAAYKIMVSLQQPPPTCWPRCQAALQCSTLWYPCLATPIVYLHLLPRLLAVPCLDCLVPPA